MLIDPSLFFKNDQPRIFRIGKDNGYEIGGLVVSCCQGAEGVNPSSELPLSPMIALKMVNGSAPDQQADSDNDEISPMPPPIAPRLTPRPRWSSTLSLLRPSLHRIWFNLPYVNLWILKLFQGCAGTVKRILFSGR